MKKVSIHFFGINCMMTAIMICVVVGTSTEISWLDSNNIFVYWLQLMSLFLVVFGVIHLFLYNFASLVRSIYYKIKGYGFFPIVFYPFCINWHDNQLKIKICLRFQVIFYDFLPNGIINVHQAETKDAIKIIKEGLYVKQYSRFGILLVLSICFLIKNPLFILIAIALFSELIVFSYIHDRRYHGERVKIDNIRNGYGIMYLVGLQDQYQEKDMENYNAKLCDLYQITENKNYVLAGVKRIILNAITLKEKEIPIWVKSILEQFIENPKQISINPDEKELDIITLALGYTLLKKDVAEINKMLSVFQSLQNEWGSYSSLWYDYFQWYIEVIEFSRKQRQNFSVKEQAMVFIKTDSIGYMPGSYNDKLKKSENMICDKISSKNVNIE